MWIERNKDIIEAGVIISVGGMFDYISGTSWRGPRWITDRGLEWLTRLIGQPGRLSRRYLIGNPLFVARVAREYLRKLPRFRSPPAGGSASV